MDIANRVGVKAHNGRGPRGTRFVVTIAGLTNNATYGLCAQRGVPLVAQAEQFEGETPEEITYQWYSATGPIAGATQAAFTPDAGLADQAEIYCVATVPTGSRSSIHVLLREVPPTVEGVLPDTVYDHDTGPQTLATAAVFDGQSLSFAAAGAGATIDPATGILTIPTDTELSGAVVTVTASNSGGAVTAAFQVTVEDVVAVEDAVSFGALTPAGAGGIPVAGTSITGGDPGAHWQVSNGMLAPTLAGQGALAGVYPLVFDNGDALDVIIEDDKASARPDEIEAVFATLPVTARGLLVQDGDARSQGRIRLEPKQFLNEMVLEPVNWVEDTDPRLSTRPVTLGGLTIGGDPSDAEILRMENLTVQGFVCQLEQGAGEPEFNNGVVLVERPSRHVTIRQNEIWSRDLAEIIAADDFRDNLSTSRQMRGITTKVYAGTNEHIRIEENWVHDVTRGMGMVATNSYQGVRSRLCGNIIEDCYTNFFTCGYLDGLDIFDNHCMGVYAANGDTLGAIPATSPHSAAGGSFDAGGSQTTANVTMMGNLFHTGWKRTLISADLGLPQPTIGATGIKFNDPQAPDSYWNLIVAFNTVISHGICMEMSGASAAAHIEVFNNTLASESYAGAGSAPVFSFGGASNVRLFNNIACDYDLNTEDNQGDFPATLDTLDGYGNLKINSGTGAFGEVDYFVGDAVKGLDLLTIDEALLAYVPKPTTRAMTAAQRKGALGTGLYSGEGVHGVVYDKPVPTGGTAGTYPLTVWDGSAYLRRSSALAGPGTTDAVTLAIRARTDVAADAATRLLFSMSGQRMYLSKFASGAVQLKVENNNDTFMQASGHGVNMASADGLVDLVISADFDKGVILFAVNGVLSGWTNIGTLDRQTLTFASAPRIFADELTTPGKIWAGALGLFYLVDRFIDLETAGGLSSIYAQDGNFRDFGADGSVPTGSQPLIFVKGTAAEISGVTNLGTGGSFELVGTITDENAGDQTAPVINGLAPLVDEVDVSIEIHPVITFSEPVAFGTGTITLFDVTAGAVAESFDVVSAVGSGPGQVAISGAALTITPTVPLQHGTVYAVQIAPTAVADLAGNAFAGVSNTATIRFSTEDAPVQAYAPSTISLVSYGGSATEAITIPGNIQAGDIILLEGLGIESSGAGTFGSHPGFVSVGRFGDGGQRKAHFMAKVADGTEAGTVVPVGDSGNGSGSGAIVLRPDIPASSLSFLGADMGIGLGSPSPKSLPSGGYTAPVLVFAFYHVLSKSSDISARNFTGMTADFEQRLLIDGGDDLWCKVRLIKAGDTPADISASMNSDHGGYNLVGISAIQLG